MIGIEIPDAFVERQRCRCQTNITRRGTVVHFPLSTPPPPTALCVNQVYCGVTCGVIGSTLENASLAHGFCLSLSITPYDMYLYAPMYLLRVYSYSISFDPLSLTRVSFLTRTTQDGV